MAPLEPPSRFLPTLRFLGPGLVLSAAVVGSGELIATTALGARAGFALLWVILLSCTVKVAVQLEYGRQAIVTGRAPLDSWNALPGARLWGIHWSVWTALLFLATSWMGVGGILGAASQAIQGFFPGVPLAAALGLPAAAAAALAFHGRYGPVETAATVLNGVFVGAILYCNAATRGTVYAYGARELLSGLAFGWPAEGSALAFAVFGITGLGAGEIVIYPYWCLEKGYAAWTGPADGSREWAGRARGWIRVMRADALLSMAVYTATTCGFYCLGAAVLSPQPRIADGNGLLMQLSGLFSQVLGRGSAPVFMVLALSVLFATLFANTAGLSRLWADVLRLFRVVPAGRAAWRKCVGVMSWVIPAGSAAAYLAVRRPLALVIFMGAANALFLLVVASRAIALRYAGGDGMKPSRRWDAALWVSVAAIGAVSVRMIVSLVDSR